MHSNSRINNSNPNIGSFILKCYLVTTPPHHCEFVAVQSTIFLLGSLLFSPHPQIPNN